MINGDKEDFNGDTKEHINISKRGLYHEIIRVVKASGFNKNFHIQFYIFIWDGSDKFPNYKLDVIN